MTIFKKIVFVIDDDQDFCLYLKLILEANGMDVKCYFTISEAEQSIEISSPDVIILDMEFKDDHGIKFLKKRKLNPRLAEIPVVVCSTQDLAVVIKAAFNFGANDYILKPLNQSILMNKIKKCLKI